MDSRNPAVLVVNVSSRGITDQDLLKVAVKMGIKKFDGVIMKEEFILYPYPKKKVIVNIGDNGIGTHWVMMYKQEVGDMTVINYFDSYGLGMPDLFRDRFDEPGTYVAENMSQIQANDSLLCGIYCLYFINEMDRGRKMGDIILDFSNKKSKLAANDKILVKYMKKYGVEIEAV